MDFYARYEFNPKKDLLGKGGFSKVYRANDTLLERTVALKFFTADASEKYQVLNEIKKVIRFEHPNLCKYYDVAVLSSKNIVGEVEKTEVGIMEYLDSGDFKTYLKANPQYLDKLLIDVLKGLHYLHKKGIVHRDLKPQNILIKMVDDEPQAKITDFGISKLISSEDTSGSTLMGTIEYMAPEQFNPKKYGVGGRITTNLDMWSFGLMVYEAISHKPMFGSRNNGVSAEQVMRSILSDSALAKADELPPKYREIVKRCLVKSAAERVQNANELIPMFLEGVVPGSPAIVNKVPVRKGSDTPQLVRQEPDEDTRVFRSEAVETDTQVFNGRPEASGEETKVLHSPAAPDDGNRVPEPSTGTETAATKVLSPAEETGSFATQVLPAAREENNESTRALKKQEETGEVTSILPSPRGHDSSGVYTQVFRPAPEEEGQEGTETIPLEKHPGIEPPPKAAPLTGKPAGEKRTVKRPVLYSIGLVLPILGFAVFLAFSGPQPAPRPAVTPALPPSFHAPVLIKVEGGSFAMGAAEDDEKPLRTVQVKSFSIGKYEVTVHQFRQFIADTRYVTTAERQGYSSIFGKDGKWEESSGINWRHTADGSLVDSNNKRIPVVHVSWLDAVEYCKWLSDKTKENFRLLTEAEWEYAAKGGSRSRNFMFSGSNNIDEVAWYSGNSRNKIRETGRKLPNELGIHDMTGNAMEWCSDWYVKGNDIPGAKNSPAGGKKVIKGGAWSLKKDDCGVAKRGKYKLEDGGGSIGFRICKSGS